MKKVALSSAAIRLDIQLTEGAPQAEYRAEPAVPAVSPREEAEHKLGAAEPDAVPPGPWVIGELEIQGNRNVKLGAIHSQVKGRKGDLYDRADLDRDIQAVLGLGNFDRVAADISSLPDRPLPPHFAGVSGSPHPVRVVFVLEEKPLVGKIEFAGRKKISKGRLKDEMELKKKDPFDQVKVRRDTEKMLELYHKKGYHRVPSTRWCPSIPAP
jgi:outer membrane protein assembly factor BamA